LDEVLARATAFHPRDRFASVHAFAEALLPFASRRMREAYQEGSLADAEVSGARIAMPIPGTRDSEITVRVRSSQARFHSQQVQQRSRRVALMLAALAGFVLACGVVLGLTQ
jgi:hypothetical protein